tara:strand:- start:4508 stop:4801 length:294 start_codon:yes stop_codon:yes gene_type:complete
MKPYRQPTLVKNKKTGKYFLFKTKDLVNTTAMIPPELNQVVKSAAAHHGIAVAELLWFIIADLAREGGLFNLDVEQLRNATFAHLGLELCEIEQVVS